MEARFVSLMNTRRFSPTLDQLKRLEGLTKHIYGNTSLSIFSLVDVNTNTGLAKFNSMGYSYQAARLLSNGRWYLTGDYEMIAIK